MGLPNTPDYPREYQDYQRLKLRLPQIIREYQILLESTIENNKDYQWEYQKLP